MNHNFLVIFDYISEHCGHEIMVMTMVASSKGDAIRGCMDQLNPTVQTDINFCLGHDPQTIKAYELSSNHPVVPVAILHKHIQF